MKLPGVRAWSSRGTVRLATLHGATSTPRPQVPLAVLAAMPDLSLQLPRVPPMPRVDPDMDDDQVVRVMALGWCLAHHAATGATRHVQPSRWSPGTRTTLAAAGRVLGHRGVSPAAYARVRWVDLVSYAHHNPKGPTAVYGVREPLVDRAATLQRRVESFAVIPGPECAALAALRRRMDQAVQLAAPQTPEDLVAILSSPGFSWRTQLERATTEIREARDTMDTNVHRGLWVWPAK